MKALASPACRLRALDLDHNDLLPDEVALVADGLAVNRSLRHLSLEGNMVAVTGVQVSLSLWHLRGLWGQK